MMRAGAEGDMVSDGFVIANEIDVSQTKTEGFLDVRGRFGMGFGVGLAPEVIRHERLR